MSRYRDQAAQFHANDAAVLGVSVDSVWANKAFAESMRLDFPLLSDPKKDVARQYGVLDDTSGLARRVTFVIDQDGIVRHIDLGYDALDPTGAVGACRLLKKGSATGNSHP